MLVFALFWTVLFLLYLPAARAGWVSDTLGWLDAIRTQAFADYVVRKGFGVHSFYQLTQIITWCFYRIFGTNRRAWHLLHLSLHALNATLLFSLLRGIFSDSGHGYPDVAAFIAGALFCTSPYVSEVIVWEAAYHFLQGLLLLLIQLHLIRRFLQRGRISDAVMAIVLYALSLFSLELFYLVPFLGGAMCIYYRALAPDSILTRKAWRYIVMPQALLLLIYFLCLQLFVGAATGRLGNEWMKLPITYYLVKPPEYFFHLLGGRFLPTRIRRAAYSACSSYVGAGIFYTALAALICYICFHFRRMKREAQLIVFLVVWLLLSLALVMPLWFPERLLIIGDRYLYVLLPPFFALIALGFVKWIKSKAVRAGIFSLLLMAQCGLTFLLNRIWHQSALLSEKLQTGLKDEPEKITILLNSPASLQGAPMIGAGADGEARLMHNLFYENPIRGEMYDAPALNLLHPSDSIKFRFIDERTIEVRPVEAGSFWQYGPDVAHSFSTKAFAVHVQDARCCYTLQLNSPASAYRLLYQIAGVWYELHFPTK